MCRLMGYLGPSIQLEHLLYQPEHSLIVQSYQPKEMTAGLLNADGFGVGWYDPQRSPEPFTYKNTVPIWSDTNLSSLSRYIESSCILANVRSATPGQAVNLSNCQPFQQGLILGMHNGFIEKFHQTLCRPMRAQLSDDIYQTIDGTTDSEHIFALLVNELQVFPDLTLADALQQTLITVSELAAHYQVGVSANLLLSDGEQLVASRFSNHSPAPSLYWLQDDSTLPGAMVIASEPLFAGNWTPCPERSIVSIGAKRDLQIYSL